MKLFDRRMFPPSLYSDKNHRLIFFPVSQRGVFVPVVEIIIGGWGRAKLSY